jgi:putative transposase
VKAVDAEGEVLDVLAQSKRNKYAALKLMRKLLKKYAFVPERLVTDDLRSYSAAGRDLGIERRHERGEEQSSREFASADATAGAQDAAVQESGFSQRFLSTHAAVYNIFNVQRHLGPNAPHASRRGDGHLANGGRSGLTTLQAPTLRARCTA